MTLQTTAAAAAQQATTSCTQNLSMSRKGERDIRYNIFKQLISIPSNYPIVSAVEHACDLCHLKYYNKALNSANAKAKPE